MGQENDKLISSTISRASRIYISSVYSFTTFISRSTTNLDWVARSPWLDGLWRLVSGRPGPVLLASRTIRRESEHFPPLWIRFSCGGLPSNHPGGHLNEVESAVKFVVIGVFFPLPAPTDSSMLSCLYTGGPRFLKRTNRRTVCVLTTNYSLMMLHGFCPIYLLKVDVRNAPLFT